MASDNKFLQIQPKIIIKFSKGAKKPFISAFAPFNNYATYAFGDVVNQKWSYGEYRSAKHILPNGLELQAIYTFRPGKADSLPVLTLHSVTTHTTFQWHVIKHQNKLLFIKGASIELLATVLVLTAIEIFRYFA